MDLANVERGGHALTAIRVHRKLTEGTDAGPAGEAEVGALLTNLLHYCDVQGLQWDACMNAGLAKYLDHLAAAQG